MAGDASGIGTEYSGSNSLRDNSRFSPDLRDRNREPACRLSIAI